MPSGLRQHLKLDVYTIIIVALIPSFLLIAAGATWFYDRAEARRACSDATAYLEDASGLAGSFQSASSVSDTTAWVTGMQALHPPPVAQSLHDTVLGTVSYATSTIPDLNVSEPGAVYDAVTPFQDSLDRSRDDLVKECPDLAAQIPDAFPMFFTKDGQ